MNYGELLSSFLIDLQRLFRADICFKDTTYSQILAIISIPADGIEMSELAWVLGLDNSTVTRLIIRLEKNYRSSQNILSVASDLIANNQNRVGKTLKTTMDKGALVKLNCFKRLSFNPHR